MYARHLFTVTVPESYVCVISSRYTYKFKPTETNEWRKSRNINDAKAPHRTLSSSQTNPTCSCKLPAYKFKGCVAEVNNILKSL